MEKDLDDYEPVGERLKKFWKDHKELAIRTSLVSSTDEVNQVFFLATILDETSRIRSTGWAHEVKGQGFVNTTSHIENCETSAIGRALANLGYQGSKRPSREEME